MVFSPHLFNSHCTQECFCIAVRKTLINLTATVTTGVAPGGSLMSSVAHLAAEELYFTTCLSCSTVIYKSNYGCHVWAGKGVIGTDLFNIQNLSFYMQNQDQHCVSGLQKSSWVDCEHARAHTQRHQNVSVCICIMSYWAALKLYWSDHWSMTN